MIAYVCRINKTQYVGLMLWCLCCKREIITSFSKHRGNLGAAGVKFFHFLVLRIWKPADVDWPILSKMKTQDLKGRDWQKKKKKRER